jgi:hypothetical protein
MAEKTITIEIDETGKSSLDLNGFHGKGCGDVAKLFQASDRVTRSNKKREFHSFSEKQNANRQQQG